MSDKILWLIIVCALWLLGLLVTGVLALVWNQKFKTYKQERKVYHNYLTITKNSYKLEPVKLEYQLPQNEIAYVNLYAEVYYQKPKERNRQIVFFENKFKQSNKTYFQKTKLELQQLRIILTNKHLVLESDSGYLKAKLNKIQLLPLTFYTGFKIICGCELIILDKRFLITNQKGNLLLAYELLKGEYQDG